MQVIDQHPQQCADHDCQLRYRFDSDVPKANSEEVCGTAYTIDTGTGLGEVVQDCYYKVYENYCSYETMQWVVVNTLVEDGYGTNAIWPSTTLSTSQRLGNSTERYTISFSTASMNSISTSDCVSKAVPAVIG